MRARVCCDGGLHACDEWFGVDVGVDDGGDEAHVCVDVGEGVRREGEDGQAGFEDGGEGFHAVGDAGDDEVGFERRGSLRCCRAVE